MHRSFKLQIFVGSRNLRKGDAHFKGETDYDSFQEGNLVKYTLGASTNYNEIYRLRKEKLEKFPEAFIIAFKNGQKYDVNQEVLSIPFSCSFNLSNTQRTSK